VALRRKSFVKAVQAGSFHHENSRRNDCRYFSDQIFRGIFSAAKDKDLPCFAFLLLSLQRF